MISWVPNLLDLKGRTIHAGLVNGAPVYVIRQRGGYFACSDISTPTERLFGLHEELTYAKKDCEGDFENKGSF